MRIIVRHRTCAPQFLQTFINHSTCDVSLNGAGAGRRRPLLTRRRRCCRNAAGHVPVPGGPAVSRHGRPARGGGGSDSAAGHLPAEHDSAAPRSHRGSVPGRPARLRWVLRMRRGISAARNVPFFRIIFVTLLFSVSSMWVYETASSSQGKVQNRYRLEKC